MTNEIAKRNEAFLIYQDEKGYQRIDTKGEQTFIYMRQIARFLVFVALSALLSS